ncbi:MAG: hypothetical protein WDZ28_02600 [Simkaniaceae bacterium]
MDLDFLKSVEDGAQKYIDNFNSYYTYAPTETKVSDIALVVSVAVILGVLTLLLVSQGFVLISLFFLMASLAALILISKFLIGSHIPNDVNEIFIETKDFIKEKLN